MAAEGPPKDPVMVALREWIFTRDDLTDRMQEFAMANCDEFDYIENPSDYEGAENKFAYTGLFHQYQGMFERELEVFLDSHGFTQDQFLQSCHYAEQMHRAEGATGVPMHHCVAALCDFNEFKCLMLDAKRTKVEGTA